MKRFSRLAVLILPSVFCINAWSQTKETPTNVKTSETAQTSNEKTEQSEIEALRAEVTALREREIDAQALRAEMTALKVALAQKADADKAAFKSLKEKVDAVEPPTEDAEEDTDEGLGVQFHGYGNWYGGWTSDNRYLSGTPDVAYHRLDFALAAMANPVEALTIGAQIHLRHSEAEHTHGTFITELDFAFAQWKFSDLLKIKIGRSAVPFGLYSLIYDVGTLSPFDALPQAVYGHAGSIPAYYNGIGLSGQAYADSGWGLRYDLYGGEMLIRFSAPFEHFDEHIIDPQENPEEEEHAEEHVGYEAITDVLGAKLTIQTAVPGLSFGAAGMFGRSEEDLDELHIAFGGHAEYLGEKLNIRAEYLHHRHAETDSDHSEAHEAHAHAEHINAFYGELSYLITPAWQLAARYDFILADLGDTDTSEAPSLVEHQDVGLGINYIFVPAYFVLKLSYHFVNGNLLAHPGSADEMEAQIHDDDLQRYTHLISLGASYSF